MSGSPNHRMYPDAFYVNGQIIPAAYFVGVEVGQFQGLNGDSGGTWAPASKLIIGGAGMWFCGPTTLANPSNGYNIRTFYGAGINHGDSDYILLGPSGVSRTYTLSFAAFGADASIYGAAQTSNQRWSYDYTGDGLVTTGSTNATTPARAVLPLDLHHGATLQSVAVVFKVSSAHSGGPTPTSLPQIRVIQVDAFGNVTPLTTNASLPGYVGNGWIQYTPAPANGTFWYFGGLPYSLTATMDAGVVVDTSRYTYFVQVVDESGTGAQPNNEYFSIGVSLAAIADMRPQ